jgi:Zn finger protein HypA/HybF involved in hydrogenase expression
VDTVVIEDTANEGVPVVIEGVSVVIGATAMTTAEALRFQIEVPVVIEKAALEVVLAVTVIS